MPTFWGVDSAQEVTQDLLDCVKGNLGKPAFWGRYLVKVSGSSEGLTPSELNRLKQNGIKLLPIYNNFTESVGYSRGTIDAQNAIYHGRRLGLAEGVPIFANIERFFDVDAEWIRGWFDTLYKSPYLPGFYFDSKKGNFMEAYCRSVSKEALIKTHSVLWSARPESGGTSPKKAPTFKPISPSCGGNVWAWQYGRDIKSCPVDTNLILTQLYSKLI